jgi:hypothetical protein
MIFPLAISGPLELPLPVRHHHIEGNRAVARVDRDQVCVARSQIQLVVVERHAALRDVHTQIALPDQVAGLAIERLDDAAGVVHVDGAVVRERRRLVGAALVHSATPTASCNCSTLSRVICVSGLKLCAD